MAPSLKAVKLNKAWYRLDDNAAPLQNGRFVCLIDQDAEPLSLIDDDEDNDDSQSEPDGNESETESESDASSSMQSIIECDVAQSYSMIVSPALYASKSSKFGPNEVCQADGAEVMIYHRCPASVNGERMESFIRYPELVAVSKTVLVPAERMRCELVRIVDMSENGELVVKAHGNGLTPCMPPMDLNDLYCRFRIPTKSDDTPQREVMCSADACTMENLWMSAKRGQLRWCCVCCKWQHVRCLLLNGGPTTVAEHTEDLDKWKQGYLKFLLSPDRPMDPPKKAELALGKSTEVDEDVDDRLGAVPWLETTWDELACLPIRRKTRSGFAPQTIEVVITHALKMVRDGQGALEVPDPSLWLTKPSVGGRYAGVRAAKYIIRKELAKLRSEGIRRFVCICCHAQLV
ncbi:hypothetical protein EV715DRAFT_297563 [Schizophyllum commune]